MSSFWAPPSGPATKLGRHRQLSPLAGVHVSPLVLGAMSIGEKWGQYGMGGADKESSFKLLDAFYEVGGNFIDTANSYQDEASEEYMIIAIQYTTNFKRGTDLKQKTAYTGNNTKSLHIPVEASLKKLRTDNINGVTNSPHNLVAQGKVLYLGVSDTPSWIVSKANTYTKIAGKIPFVIIQGAWNIIPMCVQEGLVIAPWNVLGAGKIQTDAEEERRHQTGEEGQLLLDHGSAMRMSARFHKPLRRSPAKWGLSLSLLRIPTSFQDYSVDQYEKGMPLE
ncbi:NADP-dependent oxidoreductase domain-containing protein [Irpex rosettiformis]|uniref:NADP-dependent oxidoreductase domain-containing protein n=1 Tax=Irpex rosettiformis TaxID=378272 RepID=A0ACB8TZI3_9APHY|nr:NADP-dependent oxidoreductase domain-containing protein [Irpex rosettiformis]